MTIWMSERRRFLAMAFAAGAVTVLSARPADAGDSEHDLIIPGRKPSGAGMIPKKKPSTATRLPDVPPPSKPTPPRTIVVDAGHGGKDPGAIGRGGVLEKHVNLHIASCLANELTRRPGFRAVLTRADDRYLDLVERSRIAVQERADLFVSIHADSAPNSEARGLSVYTLSRTASDELAETLADRENLAEGAGIDIGSADQDVIEILAELVSRHKQSLSATLQMSILKSAEREYHLLERPARAANFAVLKAPGVPSVLVETGFLSNPDDANLLGQPRVRQGISRAIARGIVAGMVSRPA